MTTKKVCIIGAGLGGLTAGALLIKKGYEVTIFEKESNLGGRAQSLDMSKLTFEEYKKILSRFKMNIPFLEPALRTLFDKKMFDGYYLDLGYHVIGGGIIDKLKEILSLSNKELDIIKSRLYEQKNDHYGYFVTNFEKLKMLPNFLKVFFASEKTMKRFDITPLTETIKIYGKGKMKDVLEVNSRLITTVNNLNLISTGDVFRTQKDMGMKGIRYPKNGLKYISTKLAEYIKNNKGVINLNSSVSKIIINEGKVKGVIVDEKKYFFDIVISSILVQDIFNFVDKSYFPKNYVKNIESLRGTGSLCAYYSLKKIDTGLLGKTFHFIEKDAGVDGEDAAGMIDFMSASPDSCISPSNEYLVQSYIICTPDEARDKKILMNLRNILDKNLEKIIPDYKSNLNWCFYTAIWHLDGVAKTINNEKPEIQTPIENFYLVGDCTNAPGIGIKCAIDSAKIVAQMI
jgi:phytoene dehydrogenase-like protein